MTAKERFQIVLNGGMPSGRLPMVEWAAWWDETIKRWEGEGLPPKMPFGKSQDYFGLDQMHLLYIRPSVPRPAIHGQAIIETADDYEKLHPELYISRCIEQPLGWAKELTARHDAGEILIRIWLDGFFFYPRRLFGIEPHMYAFYDEPELMMKMNEDLCRFNLQAMEALFAILKPDFIGLVEDMSYNHGPMLSYDLYKTFILPFYKRIMTCAKANDVKVLVDSDGDVTNMIPWLEDAGVDGVYPLERQAGVDIVKIREAHPKFIMLGGYDKMAMPQGEVAMRAEFERLLPVMKAGYFIPSVDHQTPPGVSLDNYNIYVRLFREYCEKAVS